MTGVQDNAALFARNNSERLTIASSLGLTHQNVSFAFWVKLTSEPATNTGYTFTGTRTSGGGQHYIDWEVAYRDISGTKTLTCQRLHPGGSGHGYLDYSTTLGTSAFHHIVATYDTSVMRLYVDGTEVASTTNTGDGSAGDNLFSIGSYPGGGSDIGGYSNAVIDELGVWTKALSATDVANLYNNGSGLPYEVSAGGTATTTLLAVRKRANESVTSSTALQDDNALSLALEPSTDYIVDAFVVATTTSKKPDLKLAFTAPSGSDLLLGYLANTGAAVTGGGILESSGSESDKVLLSPTESTVVHVVGTITTGANSGAFTLQWAQNASDSAGVTVRKGSYLKAEAI
jgi:Concanavalin A-like lectin/glucanases superfamily